MAEIQERRNDRILDNTASRLLSEVKQRRARLVGWGTTFEPRVLFFCFF